MRNCISCGRPLKINLGAEHFICAFKHPHLSAYGWILFLLGYVFPAAREKEEEIENKIRRK